MSVNEFLPRFTKGYEGLEKERLTRCREEIKKESLTRCCGFEKKRAAPRTKFHKIPEQYPKPSFSERAETEAQKRFNEAYDDLRADLDKAHIEPQGTNCKMYDQLRKKYDEACQRVAGLGQGVEVVPRADGTGFRLEAGREFGPEEPVTAFMADIFLVNQPDTTEAGKYELVMSPMPGNDEEGAKAVERAQILIQNQAVPCELEPTLFRVVSDPEKGGEGPPPPDKAAIYVEPVWEDDPYGGIMRTDEALPTLAQATLGYLQKVQARANVYVNHAPGNPTILMTTRPVLKGERFLTALTPASLLGPKWARKVTDYIKQEMPPDGETGCSPVPIESFMGLKE
jgi:hypothetical protein